MNAGVRIALSIAAGALGPGASVAAAPQSGSLELLGNFATTATGASDDGRVVVGNNTVQYWFWTPKLGVVPIGGIAPGNQGAGGSGDVSDDGSRLAFTVLNEQGKSEAAFYELDTAETQRVGNFGASCDISATSAWGISGDGQTVVGLGWHTGCAARGCSYRADVGLVDLGTIYFFESTRANAASDDGSTIVGWQDFYTGFRQAAVWRNGVESLITAPGNIRVGEAAAVSGDGRWVVGIGSDLTDNRAWRWSAETGYHALPPSPIAGFTPYATDVSDDGSRILMFVRAGPPATSGEGYLWIDGVMHPLEEFAAQQGVEVPPDVRFALPLAMSSDGRTIVGTARTAFGTQGFVLNLPRPAPCPSDLTGDGSVDAADIAALLVAWGATGTAAGTRDVNGDGIVDAGDLASLLVAWGGCP